MRQGALPPPMPSGRRIPANHSPTTGPTGSDRAFFKYKQKPAMENLLETAAANQRRAREIIRTTGLEAIWRSVAPNPVWWGRSARGC